MIGLSFFLFPFPAFLEINADALCLLGDDFPENTGTLLEPLELSWRVIDEISTSFAGGTPARKS